MKPERTRERIDRLAIVDEAVESLTQRKLRTALTCLGTVLGIGVLVSVLGLTASAASQIDKRFTAQSATEVTVTQTSDGVRTRGMAFPSDFEPRVMRIDGVLEAGIVWEVTPDVATVRSSPLPDLGQQSVQDLDILAVSPGALRIAGPQLRTGQVFDDFAQEVAARVTVLGPTVAVELGISSITTRPAITIGGTTFTVIGVLASVDRHPELLNSIIIPAGTASSVWGVPGTEAHPTGWIEVEQGAGEVVADQVAVATSASSPDRFEVTAPPSPRKLRGSIGADIQGLFLILAVICLIVGMVGIANTTFVTVMERVGEIGLRRALGARKVHVAAQFLSEAAVTGLVGGLLGTLLGISVVVAVAVLNGWTAVVPAGLAVAGPGIGVGTALVAALYPALKGARTEPIIALRGAG